jgi:hypothetical protein
MPQARSAGTSPRKPAAKTDRGTEASAGEGVGIEAGRQAHRRKAGSQQVEHHEVT